MSVLIRDDVALAAAPEHVAGAAQLDGGVDGPSDLAGGMGEHQRVGVGGRAVRVARMAEAGWRCPRAA